MWSEVEISQCPAGVCLNMTLQWQNKTMTRIPEAAWVVFNPLCLSNPLNWTMDKLGGSVNPANVVDGGCQHQHGVWTGVQYEDSAVKFRILTPDAPIVSPSFNSTDPYWPYPGTEHPGAIGRNRESGGVTEGMAVFLYGNIYNTNYPLWYPYVANDTAQLWRISAEFGP